MNADVSSGGRGARTALIVVVLLVLAVAIGWALKDGGKTPASPGPAAPEAELAYLNLGADATYVGSAACAPCHAQEMADHGRTPHGRSLGAVDIDAKLLPGSLAHERSGRLYRMASEDGAVRVQEVMLRKGGEELLFQDHALTHTVGSGEGIQCYLTEIDGFLVQAPVATQEGAWRMAPGYDRPLHESFTRPVGRACLNCHAGRVENVEESLHRIRFLEMSISCERCHGPGSVHVAHHEQRQREDASPKADSKEPDLTIVNPAHLTRSGSLDVCAQCHEDEGMTILRPGRSRYDWRPGTPLADVRLTFRPRRPDGTIPDVGYGEQLRASPCFQGSEDLTCTTCHDAHGRPAPDLRAAHYAAKCASCHGEDGCGLDVAARRQAEGGDDCTTCHMPRAEERHVHGVYTHHRVDIHKPSAPDVPVLVGKQLELVLREPITGRTKGQVDRDLALALMRLPAWQPPGRTVGPLIGPDSMKPLMEKARRLLQRAKGADALDADGAVALGTLISRQQTASVRDMLLAVLDQKDAPPLLDSVRIQGMVILARSQFELGSGAEARDTVRHLTKLRRAVEDWDFLATIANQSNNREVLLEAVEALLAIAPHLESTQYLAAEVFERLGSTERAEFHQALALELARYLADQRAKAPR